MVVNQSNTLRLCYSIKNRLRATVLAIDASRAKLTRSMQAIDETAGRLFVCRQERGTLAGSQLYESLISSTSP